MLSRYACLFSVLVVLAVGASAAEPARGKAAVPDEMLKLLPYATAVVRLAHTELVMQVTKLDDKFLEGTSATLGKLRIPRASVRWDQNVR